MVHAQQAPLVLPLCPVHLLLRLAVVNVLLLRQLRPLSIVLWVTTVLALQVPLVLPLCPVHLLLRLAVVNVLLPQQLHRYQLASSGRMIARQVHSVRRR